MQKYKIACVIHTFHDYHTSERCHLTLRPSVETETILRKSGILFRKQDYYSWVLLMQENGPDFLTDHPVLEFDVLCPDPLFYYYTIKKEYMEGENWQMEYVGFKGIYSRLKLFLNENFTSDGIVRIKIGFESKSNYWQFILIPKYTNADSKIKLLEDKNRVHFDSVKPICFPEEPSAFRITTSDPIKMKEKYEYKIRLWEVMDQGNRLLNSAIRFPLPQSMSVFDVKDTITSYIYY